jgi:hypothetical protein
MKLARGIMIVSVIFGLAGCDEEVKSGDPSVTSQRPEIVLVSMAGWTQTADTMGTIERAIVRSLAPNFPNHRITVKQRLLGLLPEGDSELFLGLEYEAWKQKKNTPAGRDDIFIAVGHSSGATAIYSLLRNGTFKNGPEAPAFLGLVDMVLPLGEHDLTGKIPRNGARRTGIVHYHTSETESIRGIRNTIVGGDHFSIVSSVRVALGLAGGAVNACLQGAPSRLEVRQIDDRWE